MREGGRDSNQRKGVPNHYTTPILYKSLNSHTHTYTHTHTCTHAHAPTHTHLHLHTYSPPHTHTYTYIHMHLHTHTAAQSWQWWMITTHCWCMTSSPRSCSSRSPMPTVFRGTPTVRCGGPVFCIACSLTQRFPVGVVEFKRN